MKLQKTLIFIAIPLILTACRSYNIDVELTPEQMASYQSTIEEYTEKINNFQPGEITTEDQDVVGPNGEIITTTVTTGDKPPAAWFIEKSRAQKKLGHNDEALETLKEVFKYYDNSTVASHNIAKIYHNAGDCKNAETYYNKLINTFKLNQYHRDIADCHLRHTKDVEKVKTHYYQYIEEFPEGEDSEFQTFINEEAIKNSPAKN